MHPVPIPRFAVPRKFLFASALLATMLAGHSAFATSETWTGGSISDGNWSDTSNWSNGIAPGSISLTNTSDIATFNTAITNGWGASATPIVIDSTSQNIKGINFDTGAGAYFIGSTAGNSLYLTSGGTIQILSTFSGASTTETINAPLVLEGSYTFANGETAVSSDSLVFNGNISATAGNTTLTISGAGTGTGNQVNGVISNGNATSVSVNDTATAGTWTLTGTNTYTGSTTVGGAGTTLIVSGANTSTGAISSNAGTLELNNTTANNGGLASGLLTLNGGTLMVGPAAGSLALSNSVSMINNETISGAQNLTFSGTFTNTQTKILTNSISGGNTLTFGNTFNLGGAINSGLTLAVTGAGNTTFGGTIEDYPGGVGTGHSALTIQATGTTTFSGANTYAGLTTLQAASNSAIYIFAGGNSSAGATTVDEGILQFDSASNGGIASGLLSLTPAGGGDIVTLQSLVVSPTISNTITITPASAGNVTVSGSNSLTLAGIVSQTASTAVTSSITGGNMLTLSGTVNIDQVTGAALTLSIAGTGNTTISGLIEDYSGGTGSVGGNLSVSTSGTTTLSGANTYSGLTTLSGAGTLITAGANSSAGAFTLNTTSGILQLDSATNGGLASGLLTLTKGTIQSLVANATLSNAITLTAVTVSGAQSITFNGAFSEASGNTLTSSITGGNTLTLGGNVNIDQLVGTGRTFTIAGTGNTTISGVIQDYSGGVGTSHGALTITNTGLTTLSGANTYGGVTTVSDGTLDFAAADSLYNGTTASWTAANIIVASGATVAFGLDGASGFTSGASSNVTTLLTNIDRAVSSNGLKAGSTIGFNTTGNGGTSTVVDVIQNTTGTGGGAVGLTKFGANALVLAAADTYTGATTVTGGTLIVTGSLSGSSSTAVTNATLEGTGDIANGVTIGNGLGSASSAIIKVGAVGATGTFSTGALTLDSDAAYQFNIDPTLQTSDLLAVNGALTLNGANLSGNVLSDEILSGGQVFDIANFTSISGAFNGLANGATFTLGDNSYIINYGTAVADEVTLTVTAVPEPQTWAMMFGSLGLLVSFQRIRRRSFR